VANQENLENDDPHGEIVRLEERIEELSGKIESCRKFILASRIAAAGGGGTPFGGDVVRRVSALFQERPKF
jgi:hypothetical protein